MIMSSYNRSYYFKAQSGFTLIELMISIAIVGILAAIAVFSYQLHIRKTDMVIIYQELNHFRLPYEILLAEEESFTDFTVNGLNMPTSSELCQFDVIAPNVDGIAQNAISCRIKNLNYLSNQTLSLNRDENGNWSCQSSLGIYKAYLPVDCR